ncbi:hypothetical protein R3P38DRAFT_2820106 [Favolaschia claudopus]|uniref:GST N-terminal domain-containing protein n=1 Tax=Favolaschia claudopus TaxID=2862362 RepID=A0AAW0EI42_9AGAR
MNCAASVHYLHLSPSLMAILKLYGWPESTATWRVAIVLHETKVPFEFVNVNVMNRVVHTSLFPLLFCFLFHSLFRRFLYSLRFSSGFFVLFQSDC